MHYQYFYVYIYTYHYVGEKLPQHFSNVCKKTKKKQNKTKKTEILDNITV